jgi:oligogalacturonide lyase
MSKPPAHRESLRPLPDESTGIKLVQLTSAAYIHTNIYPESPVFTPDGRHFVYARFASIEGPYDLDRELWLCDLETHWLRKLTDEGALCGPVVTPDGRAVLYVQRLGQWQFALKRIWLETFEREQVALVVGLRRPYDLGTISPDGRYYVTGVWLPEGDFGLVRIDLCTGTYQVIHRDPEILNPHMQFEPGRGEDILVQHNRGGKLDEEGTIVRLVGEEGATIYLIDKNGGNRRPLCIGKPYSAPTQGHQCWIGTTGRILSTLVADAEEGNLVTIGEGDERPSVVSRGMYFWHPSASRDGRFFTSDVYPGGEVVVGSLRTGRYKLLCHSGASCGGPQYTHPHPFFSPDSRYVLFNSDRRGLPHIWLAEIPEGFLEELES